MCRVCTSRLLLVLKPLSLYAEEAGVVGGGKKLPRADNLVHDLSLSGHIDS